MKYRAALAVTSALVAAALIAHAEDNLPPGLVRSGSAIMMRPIDDSEAGPAPSNNERRAGLVRFLTPADRDLYTRAFDAVERGDWIGARGLADQGHDATAHKLIEWRRLLDKNSGASFADIDAFLKSNPDWPLRDTMFARAEAALGPDLAPPAVVAWFGTRPPASSLGRIKLGEAMMATGKVEEGRAFIRQGWREGSFDPPQELAIVQKDGSVLTPDDDRRRLDNLLWKDLVSDANRELARVDDATARLGAARIALRTDPSHARNLIANLPPAVGSDPGLLFDRARTARHAGDNIGSEQLLLRISSHDAARDHPAKWWSEFNVQARGALQDRDYRTAYNIAANSGLVGGEEYSEAEFLAGWIALRYLKDPQAGLSHFQRLDANVSRPISKARAAYWQGRCYEATGDLASAWRFYSLASKSPETFYGQVALAHIDDTPTLHVPDASVEPISRDAFEKETLTRPMEVLADLGEEDLLRTFALRDLELNSSAPHARLMMQELTEWGFREIALRLAKSKSYDGVLLLAYTHPVIAVPPFVGAPPGPDPALVLGLIRQETEFDPDSVSAPGAKGLMQLMPEAARLASRQSGLAYRPNDLLSDPTYNMQLGMTELEGDIRQWNGSYILATASYNAGVHNAQKWIAAFGDPRSNVDPIDWIESIPFSETRNYVMRVLENTQIYRNRLAGQDTSLRILSDLYLPNRPTTKVLAYQPPSTQAATSSSVKTAN